MALSRVKRALCVAILVLLLTACPAEAKKKKRQNVVARLRERSAGPAPAPMLGGMMTGMMTGGRSLLQDEGTRAHTIAPFLGRSDTFLCRGCASPHSPG